MPHTPDPTSRDDTRRHHPAAHHRPPAALLTVADPTRRDTSGYRTVYAERLSIYENQVLADNEGMLLAWQDVRAKMREAFSDLIATYGFDDNNAQQP